MTLSQTTDQTDSIRSLPGKTRQQRWFRQLKRTLSRDAMDRRYYGASDHIWLGMHDIWWAITHPHKSIPRHIGQLTAVVIGVSAFGTGGYLLFDEPNSAQVNLEEPSSLFKVAADKTLRPTGRLVRRLGRSIEVTVDHPDEVQEYDGQDYRR